MNDNIEYPPRDHNKNQCGLCKRDLPKVPFFGIGWRIVALNPPSKYRTKICNECFVEWRKEHPPSKRNINKERINKIIVLIEVIVVLYGLMTFASYGINNWMGFLSGPFIILFVILLFINVFYGLLNGKIEFVQPIQETKEKKKYDFNFPNQYNVQAPFQRKESKEIPTSLYYNKCDVCNQEKLDSELFIHPDGFKICSDCIKRKK